MAFKLAQTFYIDKSSVRGSEHVTLTSIDVYFKKKPLATANRSGITNPGVSINLLLTRDNDVPNTSAVLETGYARLEYDSIVATNDASIPATFTFAKPLIVSTNKSYALAVSYDGDEDFQLWTCKEGDVIVGTNSPSSGSTARNVGKYYEYSSVVNSTTSVGSTLSDQWKPLSNVDLKFAIKVGVYAANTTATDINTTYLLPSDPAEYILYDRYHYRTNNRNAVVTGELVFQETPVAYGTIAVSSSNLSITAIGNVNFTTLIAESSSQGASQTSNNPEVNQKSYIVLRQGTGPSVNVNVREVVTIISNTEIIVDRFPTFSSNAATFSVTAAAKVSYHGPHWYTGRWWNGASMDSFVGRKVDLLRLVDTNANSTVRFVNNMVQAITVNSGGIGYSNTDTINIYPVVNANTADVNNINYIPSYSNAAAKIVTNGSGTITGVAITNAGYGLTSNTVIQINTSGGTSANLFAEVGSMVRSETSAAYFGNTVVTNIGVHRTFPHCHVLTNQHHDYRLFQHFPYYIKPGAEHLLSVSSPAMLREVDTFTNNNTFDLQSNDGRVYVLASRSNEVTISPNVVVQTANGSTVNTQVQSSSLLEVSISSNNAFSLPMVETDDVYNYKYIINNNLSGEIKGQGRALARHVSTKVNFAENRSAEDIVVYVDAYRPAGT